MYHRAKWYFEYLLKLIKKTIILEINYIKITYYSKDNEIVIKT
jgi:hypothetical protein